MIAPVAIPAPTPQPHPRPQPPPPRQPPPHPPHRTFSTAFGTAFFIARPLTGAADATLAYDGTATATIAAVMTFAIVFDMEIPRIACSAFTDRTRWALMQLNRS